MPLTINVERAGDYQSREMICTMSEMRHLVSDHNPVKLTRDSLEDTRVREITDFEGRVSPQNALKDSIAIFKRHLEVFDSINSEKVEFGNGLREVSDEQNRRRTLLNMRVNEIEFWVRAANSSSNVNITTVVELVTKGEGETLRCRNFGKQSFTEMTTNLEER
jgi:DNA-directed RNA polymerase subunit alpha